MIETNPREVTVIYHPENRFSKQAVAYAGTLADHVKEVNLETYTMTGTSLEELAELLHLPLSELINEHSNSFQSLGIHTDMDDRDLIKVIQHNPLILKLPIIITHKKAIIAANTGEIQNLAA